MNNYLRTVLLIFTSITMVFISCNKDDYYIDGGKSNPVFEGNIFEYLKSKPVQFDTITQIIKLAGMEELFKSKEITFFAPTDAVIKNTIGSVNNGGLNLRLFLALKDTIMTLSDIDSSIWRKYLSRYIFNGANRVKDYPQLDYNNLVAYPGQFYYSMDGISVFNIGVVYNAVNGVQYEGYRQLTISYVPNPSQPQRNTWIRASVSSSDIQPSNEVGS